MFFHKHFLGGTETSEIEDVARNLLNVLGEKRGAGYFQETFGLTDVGYRTSEEMVVTLLSELKENIERYEPRVELDGIDEVYDDDGKRASLLVKMRLRSRGEQLRLSVDLARRSFRFEPAPSERARGKVNA